MSPSDVAAYPRSANRSRAAASSSLVVVSERSCWVRRATAGNLVAVLHTDRWYVKVGAMTPDEYRQRTRTITTAHGEFTYLDEGEGPPVLFLHGLFMSAFMWHRAVDALAQERDRKSVV